MQYVVTIPLKGYINLCVEAENSSEAFDKAENLAYDLIDHEIPQEIGLEYDSELGMWASDENGTEYEAV